MKLKLLALLLIPIIFFLSFKKDADPGPGHSSWTHYAGHPDQSKYFEGNDITKQNVSQLKVAWYYPTDDDLPNFSSPIVVDTVMYLVAKNSALVALNVRTGKEIWIHSNLRGISRRGLNYWQSKDGSDKRLLFTLNNSIQAIDARTGKNIESFGTNGYVDMRVGLNREPASIRRVQSMMPGVLYDDLLIMGSAPGEGYFSPPGFVRAYHVVTGQLVWTFHTVPQPGEYGYDTWPKDAYKYVGGVNVWSEISVDTKRGIAYLPIGSPTFDYYGADRLGANLFGNCLVAVDAHTGKRIWHYQTVHHDIWDYDLSPAPQLLTVNHKGKSIDAVAVATKHGFIFVFDRVTGQPVFPIEERPFPASTMPGEKAWRTQPIPAQIPSFTRHEVTAATLNPYFSKADKEAWLKRLKTAKSGLFVPPSSKYETVMMPGALGGANYGNTGTNPEKGIMYVMTQEYASIYKLNKVGAAGQANFSQDEQKRALTFYKATCQTCHGPKMEGAVGPKLTNVGQKLAFNDFKSIITNGKGQMPGFVHADDAAVLALYKYLGGNLQRMGIPKPKDISGPVVASGGAKIPADAKPLPPMADYPEGVDHPADRYTTDYGLEWPGLLGPPWSQMIAYDLNTGKIKWRKPIGLDSLYGKGNPNFGAPSGTLRKGMVITSSGVVFATAKGGKLYAFDDESGKILWETTLSYEVNGQPIMYQYKGKQYLVVNAASNFTADSYNQSIKPGALPKAYVAFALP